MQTRKEEEISTEAQAVLGTYAYVFCSIKKNLQVLQKRTDSLAQKLLAHHFDVASLQLFRSSKSTSANCLTSGFLLYGLWSQRLENNGNFMPFSFTRELTKMLEDGEEEVYLCERSGDFLNVQALLVEDK